MTLTSSATRVKTDRRRSDLCSAIEDELGGIMSGRALAAAPYGPGFARLWALAGENVLGGKFVRPLLLMEMYDALQEPGMRTDRHHSNRQTAISIAAAVELLHYAFLLHDDVIDGDLVRRGRPNLIGSLLTEAGLPRAGSQPGQQAILHWARTGGILMGDMLLAATHQAFARADLPHPLRLRLLDLLEHTIIETVAGEQLDVGLGDGVIAPELETILMMCGYKTATYTFELPLRAAAALAGAEPSTESVLATAGRHLGLAFQLQDDFLSTFGDPRQHGKDPFSDLREGKQTAIIAYARMTSAWPAIEPWFGRSELSGLQAEHVRRQLSDCGAEAFVQGLIREQLADFHEILRSHAANIPETARNVLIDLAAQLKGRQS
ncbi:polyprenyl synthetase family protein [Paenarthrobacter aromaticivorans]|uniref:Polyprenyl synthetase family protein n=1 Tax=Paenarthrobacter aromaticivorans TaxID=2849150 RepID=A0ABS6I0S4_9MICC|nr:polyprenyl synthetase family protein [Paenarthrobacter sp. MMS21-TAE1-1]MBU8865229.1 polyprenyl synthetase family protein [Paenarthrobacter sp. MMS21-TAE1-1]